MPLLILFFLECQGEAQLGLQVSNLKSAKSFENQSKPTKEDHLNLIICPEPLSDTEFRLLSQKQRHEWCLGNALKKCSAKIPNENFFHFCPDYYCEKKDIQTSTTHEEPKTNQQDIKPDEADLTSQTDPTQNQPNYQKEFLDLQYWICVNCHHAIYQGQGKCQCVDKRKNPFKKSQFSPCEEGYDLCSKGGPWEVCSKAIHQEKKEQCLIIKEKMNPN